MCGERIEFGDTHQYILLHSDFFMVDHLIYHAEEFFIISELYEMNKAQEIKNGMFIGNTDWSPIRLDEVSICYFSYGFTYSFSYDFRQVLNGAVGGANWAY